MIIMALWFCPLHYLVTSARAIKQFKVILLFSTLWIGASAKCLKCKCCFVVWTPKGSEKNSVRGRRRTLCLLVKRLPGCGSPAILHKSEALGRSLPQITQRYAGPPVTVSALMVFKPCYYTQRTVILGKLFSLCLTCKTEKGLLTVHCCCYPERTLCCSFLFSFVYKHHKHTF